MGDPTRGLYKKFIVTRSDGTSELGKKHEGCDYFVLDLTHDPFAFDALQRYAQACRHEYPLLADGLEEKLLTMSRERSSRAIKTWTHDWMQQFATKLQAQLTAGRTNSASWMFKNLGVIESLKE